MSWAGCLARLSSKSLPMQKYREPLPACWAEFLPSQAYLTADHIMETHPSTGHQHGDVGGVGVYEASSIPPPQLALPAVVP